MSDLLAIESISVAYGKRRALDGVSLTVAAGEIVTLLGANGSGKSTTLRTISGHVPEGREIFPQFTVYENLLTGGFTTSPAAVRDGIERAFALFPVLRGRARQRAGTLSGGEQQMLAIARALMIRPRLLLLDEPSLGLAPRLTREIFGVIGRINAEGVTVLLVEQNARRALAFASRAYVLETGRVVISGPARALAADPRIRAAYLGLAEPPPPARGSASPDKER